MGLVPANPAGGPVRSAGQHPFQVPTAGLTIRAALGQHRGSAYAVTALLDPLTAYTLLGLPLPEIAGSVVELSDLLSPGEYREMAALRRAADWPARFAAANRLLLARHERGPRPAPEVLSAWHDLHTCAGQIPIARLARNVGWSERQLQRRFREQIGLTPKAVARAARLHHALHLLRLGRPVAEAAYRSGYCDQAHFTNDCKALTGLTPRQLSSLPCGEPGTPVPPPAP
ncbi:helix-turn-helix domain-containing protein [Streptomyces sp. NPDC020379]|uniref:helix-turn-helix domain-containing protein n=1 Tax=Streptomyces sp. NPDC020379 TaxID=3365071 RepID=UPI00378EFE18